MTKLTRGQKLYRNHETRMWVSTVILPIIGGCIILGTNPNVQAFVKNTKENFKRRREEKKQNKRRGNK
jgi:hypothetical protein